MTELTPASTTRLEVGADRIEWRAVRDLVPYARNARVHSDDQIATLAGSIGRFGFNNPVLVTGDGEIIAGHGRVLAAQRLGMERVPTIALPHLTAEQRRAYVLADNKIADLADYDQDLLQSELRDLAELDFDLTGLGFNDKELRKLLVEPDLADGSDGGDVDADEAPGVDDAAPVSRVGDVWVLGEHRVICGDSTDTAVVERLQAGRKAGLVFTDPPYGMGYGGGRARGSSPKGAKKKAHGPILNDDLTDTALVDLVWRALTAALAGADDRAALYVCLSWRTYREFAEALGQAGLDVSACIVWDKRSIGMGSQDYRPQHEFIFYSGRGRWRGDQSQSDVWSFGRDAGTSYVHPTQKPVRLIERALRNSSARGDAVLDVFGGSGSTLIACERMRRVAQLVELDPRYVDVIVRRWQDFTGGLARLDGSDMVFDEAAAVRADAA